MKRASRLFSVFSSIVLYGFAIGGCATPYSSSGITGGYSEKELEPGIWRVVFGGNRITTRETVQTFWLYRAAELTLEKGYDGFELTSTIALVSAGKTSNIAEAKLYRISSVPIFIPMYIPQIPIPMMTADIKLLKKPFSPVPAKIFDASALKAALEPIVKGKLCDSGNFVRMFITICCHPRPPHNGRRGDKKGRTLDA